MRYILGADVGGTQLRAALATADGQLLHEVRMPTGGAEGPAAVIERLVACLAQARAALPEGGQLLGIGVGAPGPLDPEAGVVLNPPNLPGWVNIPLRAMLEERTGLPVVLGNDANAAALGEWMFGGGRGARHLVYVTISTGIGGGVISDGRLLLGRLGSAGEVGLHIIDSESELYWEQLASGTGLARAAAEAMGADPTSMLHQMATAATVSAADVSRAAAAGDALARRLLDREAHLIGIGLVNILHLYSPELIVLGGGVVVHNPELLDKAHAVVQRRALPIYRDVPVRVAMLGDRVGILGAVALYLHISHQSAAGGG